MKILRFLPIFLISLIIGAEINAQIPKRTALGRLTEAGQNDNLRHDLRIIRHVNWMRQNVPISAAMMRNYWRLVRLVDRLEDRWYNEQIELVATRRAEQAEQYEEQRRAIQQQLDTVREELHRQSQQERILMGSLKNQLSRDLDEIFLQPVVKALKDCETRYDQNGQFMRFLQNSAGLFCLFLGYLTLPLHHEFKNDIHGHDAEFAHRLFSSLFIFYAFAFFSAPVKKIGVKASWW